MNLSVVWAVFPPVLNAQPQVAHSLPHSYSQANEVINTSNKIWVVSIRNKCQNISADLRESSLDGFMDAGSLCRRVHLLICSCSSAIPSPISAVSKCSKTAHIYLHKRTSATNMSAEMDTNYREGRLVCLFSSEFVGEGCGRGKQVCVPITMKFEKTMR